jgi:hypothetical protein
MKITGTIPATLKDVKIDPPKLLALPVKKELSLKVDKAGRPQ